MKSRSFTVALIATFFLSGTAAYSRDGASTSESFGLVGYRGVVPPYAQKQSNRKPRRAYKLKTVEISRIGFTRMKKHWSGVVMKTNYIRVTYKSYYSDGSEVICTREYRS